jgi:hypothetical protein
VPSCTGGVWRLRGRTVPALPSTVNATAALPQHRFRTLVLAPTIPLRRNLPLRLFSRRRTSSPAFLFICALCRCVPSPFVLPRATRLPACPAPVSAGRFVSAVLPGLDGRYFSKFNLHSIWAGVVRTTFLWNGVFPYLLARFPQSSGCSNMETWTLGRRGRRTTLILHPATIP